MSSYSQFSAIITINFESRLLENVPVTCSIPNCIRDKYIENGQTATGQRKIHPGQKQYVDSCKMMENGKLCVCVLMFSLGEMHLHDKLFLRNQLSSMQVHRNSCTYPKNV